MPYFWHSFLLIALLFSRPVFASFNWEELFKFRAGGLGGIQTTGSTVFSYDLKWTPEIRLDDLAYLGLQTGSSLYLAGHESGTFPVLNAALVMGFTPGWLRPLGVELGVGFEMWPKYDMTSPMATLALTYRTREPWLDYLDLLYVGFNLLMVEESPIFVCTAGVRFNLNAPNEFVYAW